MTYYCAWKGCESFVDQAGCWSASKPVITTAFAGVVWSSKTDPCKSSVAGYSRRPMMAQVIPDSPIFQGRLGGPRRLVDESAASAHWPWEDIFLATAGDVSHVIEMLPHVARSQ